MTKTKLVEGFQHRQYQTETLTVEEIEQKARQFYQSMDSRRSVRAFSDSPISRKIIEDIICCCQWATLPTKCMCPTLAAKRWTKLSFFIR
jgi:hypothetical protein